MPDDSKPMNKVVLAAAGVSVTVETTEPLAAVVEQVRQLHQETHQRCVGALPAGFGGAL